jgi:hypothetical protein
MGGCSEPESKRIMRLSFFMRPAGDHIRLLEEIRTNPKTREVIQFLFHVTIGFALILILVRALPYEAIRKLYFPFMKIENVLYAAMILFIIDKVLAPSEEAARFFNAPVETHRNPEFRYKKKDVLIVGAAFLFSIAYLLVIYNKELPNLDESWILTMSDRVLRNDIPYRDFFTLTSPGSIYLNAWVFQTFGTSIIVERVMTLILACLGTASIYLLARLGMGFFYSLSASLLFLAWQFPFFFQASYSWYANVLSICAFIVMGLTIQSQGNGHKKLILVGALCSLCFLFKQNVGAFTLIAIALYFPAERILFDRRTKRRLLFPLFPTCFGFAEIKALVKKNAMLFVGFVIPTVICAYAFHSKGALTDFVQGVFVIPLQNTQEYHTPYEALTRLTDKRIMMYMPHFMMLVTFGVFIKRFRLASLRDSDRFPLLMALATVFMHFSTYPRGDFIHIVFSLWPSIVLLVYWTQQSTAFIASNWPVTSRPLRFLPSFELKLRDICVVVLACIPLMIFLIHRTEKNISIERDLAEIHADRGQGIYGNRSEVSELNQMIAFVESYPDCSGSDVVFSTTPLLYFLTKRENPTPYDYILAGNGPVGYEKDILEFLENQRPCMIVIDTIFTDYYPIAEDWNIIERYINRTYEIGFDSARYKVLLPAGSSGRGSGRKLAKVALAEQGMAVKVASSE